MLLIILLLALVIAISFFIASSELKEENRREAQAYQDGLEEGLTYDEEVEYLHNDLFDE